MSWLITGGTGTLGHALTHALLTEQRIQHRLVIFSRDEWKQAQMQAWVQQHWGVQAPVRFYLGDVRDPGALRHACRGITRIVHAAALKRVDSVANQPLEVKKTNVDGTQNVLEAALEQGVSRVLLASTDKACQPTNIYGATKQLAEQLTVSFNCLGYPAGLRSAVIRYGNVLSSRGSVLDVWRTQRTQGQPLTLTDPTMTRFLLTPAQAAQGVLMAVEQMRGGEVFVPHLSALRLPDLAEALAPGHPIRYIGRRPGGEKLHEQLVSDEEACRMETRPGWYVLAPAICTWTRDRWITDSPPLVPPYTSANVPYLSIPSLQALMMESSSA
mgnify:CR=1 FL=1